LLRPCLRIIFLSFFHNSCAGNTSLLVCLWRTAISYKFWGLFCMLFAATLLNFWTCVCLFHFLHNIWATHCGFCSRNNTSKPRLSVLCTAECRQGALKI